MNEPIPTEALENHIVFLAKTGAGKSNAAKTVVEGMLDRKERVCIIDPTGTWYGLRLMPNGKPSPYKVLIFGGNHADVQIGGGDGAAIAEVVGTSATSCIIDTRLLSVGDRTRFFTAFAETLLAKNVGVLNLVIDEAHLFAPKGKVNDPKSGMMLGAASNLVSLGRGIGLRIIMLSQRPAKFHNDCLSCAETLVAMRMLLPADRDAVMSWVKEHADAEQGKQIASSLSGLPTGDAWIWSPQLDLLERRRFPLVKTKDTGRPPRPDEARVDLEPLQIDEISARLKQVAAEVLANDPKALKAEIARLRAEAAKAPIPAPATGPTPAEIEDMVQTAYRRGLNEGERLEWKRAFEAAAARNRAAIEQLSRDLTEFAASKAEVAPASHSAPSSAPAKSYAPSPRAAPALRSPATQPATEGGVSGSIQKLLDAIAWWNAFGLDAPSANQVGFISGYAPSGGTFRTYRGAAKGKGLIIYPADGRIALTDLGRSFANAPSDHPSVAALHDAVRANIGGSLVKILDPLLQIYPDALTAEQVGEAAGYDAAGGTFRTYRGKLKGLEIIEYPGAGLLRAADWLFPGASQ